MVEYSKMSRQLTNDAIALQLLLLSKSSALPLMCIFQTEDTVLKTKINWNSHPNHRNSIMKLLNAYTNEHMWWYRCIVTLVCYESSNLLLLLLDAWSTHARYNIQIVHHVSIIKNYYYMMLVEAVNISSAVILYCGSYQQIVS